MGKLMVEFIILASVCGGFSLIMHAKGPTHKKFATDCLEQIIRHHFHFRYLKPDENHTMLFTVMVTQNMGSPAFEIQENIIQKIHNLAKWYQIEIISDGNRIEFESYEQCSADDCQKRFIIDFKSNFYVIVIDEVDKFETILQVLEESDTFNPKALYLVYVEYEGPKYKDIAWKILSNMWQRLLVKTAVLIPKTIQVFNLYRLSFATKGPYECASNVTMSQVDQCVQGNMHNITKHYFKAQESRNLQNCSMGVISKPYKPFVINETHGFEIEVLQSIADIINVHLNITMCGNLTDTWGEQDANGSWTGSLKLVYEDYYLGVGNIETGMSEDFAFSRFYHMEPLVFVVPIARFVPKWRVIIAIFTVQMWGICGGIIICFAISFYISSKFGHEIEDFKHIGKCVYQSVQIIILHAVPVQPVTDLTRVFFISLAVISIILSSAYTCSLVYYLKNPIREHQAASNSDIMDSFGQYKYEIGGVSKYRDLFTFSSEEEGTELYEMYQIAAGENNTLLYWINKVAEDRDIWTVSSKLFVNYLLAHDSNVTTDQDGKPKIYVFRKKLMSYSLSFVMRKGHPLLTNIDYAIRKLTWGGLVAHMSAKYTEAIAKKKSILSDDDDTYKPLAIDNLQGAFALLLFGFTSGFITLLVECICKKYRGGSLRRVGINRVGNVVKYQGATEG